MAQTDTRGISLERFMCLTAFKRGLAEVRAGRPPDFDGECDQLVYEAGRLFGCLAPRTMQITLNGRINPKATTLFERVRNEVLA